MNKQEQENFDERDDLARVRETLDKSDQNRRLRELQVNSMPYRDLPFNDGILMRFILTLKRMW